ncbi:hypothetical protein ACXJJ3_00635 [Kribbella sp. WER1]
MIRRVVGVLLAVAGLVIAVVGGAAAFWLIGPDDTVHSGEQQLSSKGLAIATTPELLNRHGPVLHVDVRSTKNQPVFVGVARDFDVASYLKGTGHTKLVQVQYPIALSTEDEKGTAGPLAAPATLDWWVTKAHGAGTQSIAWPIEDGPYDLVVMNADGKTAPDVRADLGIEIPKAFLTSLAILAIGLILLAVGIFLTLCRRRPKSQDPRTALPHTPPSRQESQPTTAPGPVRRVAVLASAIALATGCSAIPPADTVTSLTRPAIGDDTAAAVLKQYNEVSSKAIKARDDRLVATIEGGNLLRQSQSRNKISRVLDKPGQSRFVPVTYTKPVVGAPQYGGYPMRFVAASAVSGTTSYSALAVWERQSAGAPWLMTHSVWPLRGVKVPAVAGVRAIDPTHATGLATAPTAAATALAQYLTAGATSPKARSFEVTPPITAELKNNAASQAELAKTPKVWRGQTFTYTLTGTPAAFLTTTGEALVFLTLTSEDVSLTNFHIGAWWNSGEAIAFSPRTSTYESALTATTQHEVVLAIPPKAGKIRVVAYESQLVDAGGY